MDVAQNNREDVRSSGLPSSWIEVLGTDIAKGRGDQFCRVSRSSKQPLWIPPQHRCAIRLRSQADNWAIDSAVPQFKTNQREFCQAHVQGRNHVNDAHEESGQAALYRFLEAHSWFPVVGAWKVPQVLHRHFQRCGWDKARCREWAAI